MIVLAVTISLLFYYTFQNEINMLNSFAENEYIPTTGPNIQPDHKVGGEKVEKDLITNAGSTMIDLSDPDTLCEKNKYFPLLLQDASKDPSQRLGIQNNRETSTLLTYKEKHPVLNEVLLPPSFSYITKGYPKVQSAQFEDGGFQQNDLLAKIRQLMTRNWAIDIFPHTLSHEWPISLVDSMDTLYIAGLQDEFEQALSIVSQADFKIPPDSVNVIDIPDYSTRLLGGLISAFELSQDQILLKKASEVADFLLRSFDTPNRIPILQYEWRSKIGNKFPYQNSKSGGLTSMTVELLRLSQITQTRKYFDAVKRIYKTLALSSDEFALMHMFPSKVDASGCSLISKEDVKSGKHLRDSRGMKSIDQTLNFVHCHQTGRLLRTPANQKGEAELFSMDAEDQSLYANMLKSLHLLNGNDLLKVIDDDHVDGINKKGQKSPKEKDDEKARTDLEKEVSMRKIFVQAMTQINDYMMFTPLTPLSENLTLISSLKIKTQLVPATNELNVEITKLFDMHHGRCSLASTLGMGAKILGRDGYMTLADKVTSSCFELFKLFNGIYAENMFLDPCNSEQCSFDVTDKLDRISGGYYNSDRSAEQKDIGEGITLSEKEDKTDSLQRVISFASEQGPAFLNINTEDIDMVAHQWKQDPSMPLWVNGIDRTSILSSNLIESIFYMYRISGESRWRKMGQTLFKMTLETLSSSNSGAKGVWTINELHDDAKGKCLSEWYSKTLKYYYLLFSNANDYTLDDYVFTFGGHLMRRESEVKEDSLT